LIADFTRSWADRSPAHSAARRFI